jgi:hypothetical protein
VDFDRGSIKVFPFVSVGLDHTELYFFIGHKEVFIQKFLNKFGKLFSVDIIQRNINIVTFLAQ